MDVVRPLNDRQRGSTITLTAMAMVPLLLTAALAVDVGRAHFESVQVRTAADAGALAGAAQLGGGATAARNAAADLAFENLGYASAPGGVGCGAGTDTRCYTQGTIKVEATTPYTLAGSGRDPATLLAVRTCTTISTAFARVVGLTTSTVCATSVAAAGGGTGVGGPCGLCLLNPSGTGISSTGAGTVRVNGHSIGVNSTSSGAGSITGSGTIWSTGTGAGIMIRGTYSQPSPGQFSPTPATGPAITDPLAALPVPSVAGPNYGSVSVSGSSNLTLSPGIYDKITSSSSGRITLQPGIYVITTEIKLSKSPPAGGISLYGRDVMIYLACDDYPTPCASGENGADLSSSGGAVMDLGPRLTDPVYKGMTVFADRQNVGTIGLTGSSGTVFNGTVYGKSAVISMTGPSGVTSSWGSVIIGGRPIKTGDSAINLTIDPATNHPAFSATGGTMGLVG